MAMDPAFGWILVAACAAAQGVALLLARPSLRLLRIGRRTHGTVIECDETIVSSGRGPPRRYFLPVVGFTTSRGEEIVYRAESGGRVALAKSARVEMIYNPDNPRNAQLATFRALWLPSSIVCAFGIFFLAAGLGALL